MPDEAERAFLAALDRSPDDPATRGVYADWLEERGRLDDALAVRAGPIAHAYRGVVHAGVGKALGAVARMHGRLGQGCVVEIAGWPLAEPARLLHDAQRFVKSRGWDPAEGPPLAERAALVMTIETLGRRRLFSDHGSKEQRDLVALHAVTELVLDSYVAIDGPVPRPSGPIDGIVTVRHGVVHHLGTAGVVSVRIDATIALAIGELASRALVQPYVFDGAPDTARARRITEARLSHFGVLGAGPRVGRLVLSEHVGEASSIDPAWCDLVELLDALLRPRMRLSEPWRELAGRCRRAP